MKWHRRAIRYRGWLLFAAIVLPLAAWLMGYSVSHPPPRPAPPTPILAVPLTVVPAPAVASAPAAIVDIFALRSWEPPPPPAPPMASMTAPAKAEAPTLPFRFIGRITAPGKPVAYLLGQGDQVLSVSIGDSIDQLYRVEKYEAGQLIFYFEPLKIRQPLLIGEAQG